MALDYLFPNLDTRPAIEILAENWNTTAAQMQVNLSDKYGASRFYEARQELEEIGYMWVEHKNGMPSGFVKAAENSNTYSTLPVDVGANSNVSKTVVSTSNVPSSTTVNPQTGNVTVTPLTKTTAANNFKMFVGSLSQAIACTGVGISLGKWIDSELYNANPDYWDSIGLSSLNPETWNSITNGDDSFAAGLFNTIFGLDPNTGEGQLYLDQNAYAYIAMALNQNGWFSTAGTTAQLNDTDFNKIPSATRTKIVQPVSFSNNVLTYRVLYPNNTNAGYIDLYEFNNARCAILTNGEPSKVSIVITSLSDSIQYTRTNTPTNDDGTIRGNPNTSTGTLSLSYSASYDGVRYYGTMITNYALINPPISSSLNPFNIDRNNNDISAISYILWHGDITETETINGVSNQDNATLPDTSNWNDLASTLASLQQQYPDLFNNSVQQNMVNPDGTENTTTYIPIPMPQAANAQDVQPTSGTQTQNDIIQQLSTLPESLSQWITQYVVPTTTSNPPNTGTGDTPPIPPITGNASALWTVYHPSQSQVDSFGGWLWSGNIITQIQQILQNPMEGIITLHKVFAMPVDSGSGTIVVGRLDSSVPSATVTQQYVTVDCGSVQLNEMFGNVFDYTNTNVSLYLPFIGIVPLNVSDVMRSTIHVSYGVDIFTGACLAMVEVSRDACTANLYQYSGVCSVEYPLTGSVHSGLINGLLGIAGGMVGIATAGTGIGAVAGVGAVASGLASAGHSNNARAGSFSGNAGAMGIKKPYLIIERPQTKIAETYETLQGYPTNYSVRLSDCSGNVVVSYLHVHGINATDTELDMITTILQDGVIV